MQIGTSEMHFFANEIQCILMCVKGVKNAKKCMVMYVKKLHTLCKKTTHISNLAWQWLF